MVGSPATLWSCPTTGDCSRPSARSCGSWTTARPSRSTAAIGRGGPRSPAAGRWPARSRHRPPAWTGTRPAGVAAHRVGPDARIATGRPARGRCGGRHAATATATAAGQDEARTEAVEGRLSPTAGRGRRGPHPARPSQEPSRAGAGRPGRRRELRRDGAASRANSPMSRWRSRPPRMPGSTWRSGRREPRATRSTGPVRIGLTGPIGCGKSTVAAHLASRGAIVIDADQVARDVTGPGEPATAAIAARFGDERSWTGRLLDRAALGRIVFADPAALADLEAIVHPAVRPPILAALDAASATAPRPSSSRRSASSTAATRTTCDEVWVVDCSASCPAVAPGRPGPRGGRRGTARSPRRPTWSSARGGPPRASS